VLLIALALVRPTEVNFQTLENASVRIIATDKQDCPNCKKKHGSYGSGTIIKSFKEGDVFVNYLVTARHVVDKDEEILVEIFEDDKSLGGCQGELLLKSGNKKGDSDVALIKFTSSRLLTAVSVADDDYELKVGDLVITVGCPHGTIPPKALNTNIKVKAVSVGGESAYLIECEKIPEQGRSGGGLFNKSGQLVGICNAQHDCPSCGKIGIYSSWKEIIKLIKGTKYEFLLNKNP
jgi:S1-C subfamily serine protease